MKGSIRSKKWTFYLYAKDEELPIILRELDAYSEKENSGHYEMIKDEENDQGYYVNVIKGEGEPPFMFKDEMLNLTEKLKQIIEAKSIMLFNENIELKDPSLELKRISPFFKERVVDNYEYYQRFK